MGRDESTVNSNMLVVAKVWVCDLMRNCFGELQMTDLLPLLITSTEISLTTLSQLIHRAISGATVVEWFDTRCSGVFGRHGGYCWGQPDIHGCIFSAGTLVGIQYRLFLELPPAQPSVMVLSRVRIDVNYVRSFSIGFVHMHIGRRHFYRHGEPVPFTVIKVSISH